MSDSFKASNGWYIDAGGELVRLVAEGGDDE